MFKETLKNTAETFFHELKNVVDSTSKLLKDQVQKMEFEKQQQLLQQAELKRKKDEIYLQSLIRHFVADVLYSLDKIGAVSSTAISVTINSFDAYNVCCVAEIPMSQLNVRCKVFYEIEENFVKSAKNIYHDALGDLENAIARDALQISYALVDKQQELSISQEELQIKNMKFDNFRNRCMHEKQIAYESLYNSLKHRLIVVTTINRERTEKYLKLHLNLQFTDNELFPANYPYLINPKL